MCMDKVRFKINVNVKTWKIAPKNSSEQNFTWKIIIQLNGIAWSLDFLSEMSNLPLQLHICGVPIQNRIYPPLDGIWI